MIKHAQKQSDVKGKASAAQLSGLQSQFNDLDDMLSSLQTTQKKLADDLSTLQHNNATQFDEIRGNMVSSMEVTNDISISMVDMRSQFSRMSLFMMEMTKKMDAVLTRCDGVPPDVNVSQRAPIYNQGSEFSSFLGDP